jgi:Rha family phage regulatory protein
VNELVFKSEKGTPVTNSLLVAEKFGKRHADVIRGIDTIIKQTPEYQSKRNFALSEYHDASGKSNPLYIMTRDGFSILVMGFTGENAMRFKWDFIDAFNKMEEQLKSGFSLDSITRKDLAKMLLESEEEKERLQLTIETQKPKVKYYEAVLSSDNLMTVTEIAKNYGWSAVTLNATLQSLGVQYKKGNKWFIVAKYQDKDYVRFVPTFQDVSGGKRIIFNEMKWTEAGRKFIHELLVSKGQINRQQSLGL